MTVDPNAQALEQAAAAGTGIPFAVTHQQAIAESGETDTPTSSAGARGFWQFLPSTYNSNASAAGVPAGSWNNPADETKVYIVYMNQLLKQEGGSIFKALEAYNAGPGNLGAGAGYAAGIMGKAGLPTSATAGTANTNLAGIHIPGTGITVPTPSDATSLLDPATWIGDLGKVILGAFGVPSAKDMLQRLGLILFGVGLVFVGIRILSNSVGGGGGGKGGGGGEGSQETDKPREEKPQKTTAKPQTTEALSGGGAGAASTSESGLGNLGAGEAVEAAEIA